MQRTCSCIGSTSAGRECRATSGELRGGASTYVRGAASVDAAEADAYFASRSRESQVGAWASAQSRPYAARAEFDRAYAEAAARFADQDVPRPPHWLGYRVALDRIEFWQGRDARLHDRLLYTATSDGWTTTLLFP